MAEGVEEEGISRRMVTLRLKYKQNKSLPANISRWASSPKERVFPRRWLRNGHKNFDEFIESGEEKEAVFMRSLRDSRGPMTLPLSGDKIRIIDDGDVELWIVRAKEFGEGDDRDFPELRKHLQPVNLKLRVHRNSGKADPPQLSWGELAVFLRANNFIHTVSHSVGADILSKDPKEKRKISGEIDANYLECLLALETLHPGPVLQAISEFLIRIEKTSRRFALITEDLYDARFKFKQDLNSLSDSCKRILKVIGKNLDKIAKSSAASKISLADCMSICKEFDKIEALTASNVCSLVIGGPSQTSRDEKFNGFKSISGGPIKSVQKEDEVPYGILRDRVSEFIAHSTSLYWRINQEKIVSDRPIDENSVRVRFPEEAIREELADETTPSGSWLQEFVEVAGKFQQISAVLKEAKGEVDIAKEKIDEIEGHISSIKSKDVTFTEILEVLANKPANYVRDYAEMADRTNYESLSDTAIADLEKFATMNESNRRLQKILEEMDIGPNKTMELFQLILRKKDKAKELERRAHREIGAVSMAGTVASKGEWDKIQSAREEIKNSFTEGIRDLRKIEGKNKVQVEKSIRKFVTSLISGINKLESICESILGGVTVERGNGALLVGMGQGGQQILRAMIANLMNTTFDDRTKNMLRAIGMSDDEVKKVGETMINYHGKVEKISRNSRNKMDSQAFQELKSIFDECNVLAMNLGPETKSLMEEPYSFVWGSVEPDASKNKKNVVRLCRNILLMDPDEEGAGGKLGKGRAFADQAKDEISQVLGEFRDRRKRITHVALIHSFAGGSGSGMILPMLTEMKLQFPSANIWTFSAGPGTDDDPDFGEVNTTYITSDILQSHYNALHHRAEDIDVEAWSDFCNAAKTSQENMRNLWIDTLKPWFGAIDTGSRQEQK